MSNTGRYLQVTIEIQKMVESNIALLNLLCVFLLVVILVELLFSLFTLRHIIPVLPNLFRLAALYRMKILFVGPIGEPIAMCFKV